VIFWSKHDKKLPIIDVMRVELKKDATLEEAAAAYEKSGKLIHPSAVKGGISDLFTVIERRRKISGLTVGDALKVFDDLMKKKGESEAFRARANLANIVKFHCTGEVPAPLPRAEAAADAAQGDVGKLVFKKAKLADIQHLVPLYSVSGRFGWVKAEVQKLVFFACRG
jgi:hypothetical protein